MFDKLGSEAKSAFASILERQIKLAVRTWQIVVPRALRLRAFELELHQKIIIWFYSDILLATYGNARSPVKLCSFSGQ